MLVAFFCLEFNTQLALRLGRFSLNNVLVVAMRAELISLLHFAEFFTEDLLTFLARKSHFGRFL